MKTELYLCITLSHSIVCPDVAHSFFSQANLENLSSAPRALKNLASKPTSFFKRLFGHFSPLNLPLFEGKTTRPFHLLYARLSNLNWNYAQQDTITKSGSLLKENIFQIMHHDLTNSDSGQVGSYQAKHRIYSTKNTLQIVV